MSNEKKQSQEQKQTDMLLQGEMQLGKILDELLNDPEVDFREVLSHIRTLKEVHLLMVKLNELPLSMRTIGYVNSLKKRFDHLYQSIIRELNRKIQKAEREGDHEGKRKLVEEKESQEREADRFSTIYSYFQERAKEYVAKLEEHTHEKRQLLEKLRQIVENEEVTRLKEVKEIQRVWRQMGPVHPRERKHLEETFRALIDRFFKLREVYKNLVLTDREENYRKKEQLLEDFKSLLDELKEKGLTSDDIKDISGRIQNIFDLWESIGPVPREKEAIEVEYRALKKEYLRSREERALQFKKKLHENLKKQEALLGELKEVLSRLNPRDTQSWKDTVKKVNQIRKLRRRYLPIPKAEETRIRQSFGRLLSEFDQKATQYFEQLKEAYQKNFETKEKLIKILQNILKKPDSELVHYRRWVNSMKSRWSRHYYTPRNEKTEALRTQWNALVDEFAQRIKAYSQEQAARHAENLEKKKALLQEIQNLLVQMEEAEKTEPFDPQPFLETLQRFQKEWMEIGEVPLEERPRLQDRYYRLLKRFYGKIYRDDRKRADMEFYRTKIEHWLRKPYALSRLEQERAQLKDALNELRDEIRAKEKTLTFVAPGKEGEALRNEIEKRVERLRSRLELVKARLKYIDEQIKTLYQKEKQLHQELLASMEGPSGAVEESSRS